MKRTPKRKNTRTRIPRLSSVHDVRRAIERHQYPRLQMLIIVLLTGAGGFIASAIMLHLGVTEMAFRYFLAVCLAYLVFLFIMWVWLRWRADSLDGINLSVSDRPAPSTSSYSGQGGTFDGGGASADYTPPSGVDSVDFKAGSAFDGVKIDADAGADVDIGEVVAIPLVVVALIAGLGFCALSVVYSAPVLFAELLVDGLLSASLYRRLRGIDRHHWLQTALRRTALPFIFAAISMSAIGACLNWYTPGAQSIGQAIGGHADSIKPD